MGQGCTGHGWPVRESAGAVAKVPWLRTLERRLWRWCYCAKVTLSAFEELNLAPEQVPAASRYQNW